MENEEKDYLIPLSCSNKNSEKKNKTTQKITQKKMNDLTDNFFFYCQKDLHQNKTKEGLCQWTVPKLSVTERSCNAERC